MAKIVSDRFAIFPQFVTGRRQDKTEILSRSSQMGLISENNSKTLSSQKLTTKSNDVKKKQSIHLSLKISKSISKKDKNPDHIGQRHDPSAARAYRVFPKRFTRQNQNRWSLEFFATGLNLP